MLKVTLPDEVPEDLTTEAIVDKDIEEFSTYFRGLGNDPVIRSEKAIIKTYLAWKLGVGKK